jgi:hypothetical protein
MDVILEPILLTGYIATYAGQSCLSVSLFLSLVNDIISSYDTFLVSKFSNRVQNPTSKSMRTAWRKTGDAILTTDMVLMAEKTSKKSALWGPIFWQALHNLSAFFDPQRNRKKMLEMFVLLPFVLPCRTCRIHAHESVRRMRNVLVAARTRGEFVNAVVELHNFITHRIKPVNVRRIYKMPWKKGVHPFTVKIALSLLRNHGRSSHLRIHQLEL